MNVLKDIKNSLLKRREVLISLESMTNPGMAGAKKVIAEQFKASEDHVVIKRVEGSFGKTDLLIEAFIYESPEFQAIFEPRKKVKEVKG